MLRFAINLSKSQFLFKLSSELSNKERRSQDSKADMNLQGSLYFSVYLQFKGVNTAMLKMHKYSLECH